MSREELNDKLTAYTDKNCLHCYAQIKPSGKLQLDGDFDFPQLYQIIDIFLEYKNT